MSERWHERAIHDAYAANRTRLVAFARRTIAAHRLSDADVSAEDVVHDAYLKALTRWSEIEEPLPWLFAVIANRVGEIRRRSATTAELVDGVPWRWSSSTPTAAPEVVAEFRVVLGDLARLPEAEGAVAYLARVQGWTHEEIAAYRGISAGSSRVILHRATRRLRHRWSALQQRNAPAWQDDTVHPALLWGAVLACLLLGLALLLVL
jgi:RNA polymerase sigma factor (sigma-70 family)